MKLIDDARLAVRLAQSGAQSWAITQRQKLGAVRKALGPGSFSGSASAGSQWWAGGEAPDRGSRALLQMAATNPWLASVLEIIATQVASLPWQLYAVRSRRTRRYVHCRALASAGSMQARDRIMRDLRDGAKVVYQDKSAGRQEGSVDLVQVLDHPMLDMLSNPCPALTGRQSMMYTQKAIDVKGEAFWWLQSDDLGRITGYWVIPSSWVSGVPSESKPYYRVNKGSLQVNVPEAEMVWFRSPGLSDPYGRGTGVAESLGDELDTDEYAAHFTKAFFYNRARPDVLIDFGPEVDESVLKRTIKDWDNKLRGHWKAHRPHFIGANVRVHELSKSLADIDMSKLRGFERDAITNVFGVPPEICGRTQNSNRAAVIQAEYLMARYVTIPRMEANRDILQERVVPLFDDRLIVMYPNPMPDDADLQLDYMRANPAAATRGEWRRRQGFEDRGDLDNVHLQGFSTVAVPPEQTGQAAPPQVRAKAQKKTLAKQMTMPLVDAVLERIIPQTITRRIDPLWADELAVWIAKTGADLGVAIALGKFNPAILDHINAMGAEKISKVTKTTKAMVRDVLAEAVEGGMSAKETAKLIKEAMGGEAWKGRAMNIARTEVNRSANWGTYYAHSASGVVDKRQWLATESLWDTVREAHRGLHEQIVGMQEPFSYAGYSAMFPGDFGVPSLDVRCRCTTVAVIDDDIKSADDMLIIGKAFIANTDPWIDVANDAILDAFAEQADIIATEILARA